jgi:hypothetical protein
LKAKDAKSKSSKIKVCIAKAATIPDLVRYIYKFDGNRQQLFFSSMHNMLFAFGDALENMLILNTYIVEMPLTAKALFYKFDESDGKEEIKFVDSISEDNKEGAYINIIKIDFSNFEIAKDSSQKIFKIRMDSNGIIKSLIKKAIHEEELAHMYVFQIGSKIFIGAFNIFEELSNLNSIFYYAEINDIQKEKFIRYNYSKDNIDFSNVIGEYKYIYIKLIYLSEPFNFIKNIEKS